MIVYHRTHAAAAILADGFRDGEDYYMTSKLHGGVWVSNVPLDVNEGADGDRLLTIEVSEEAIADYEWVQDPSFGYREWLVPAELLNRFPVVEVEACDA
jgi:hypothetical protein